jgi:hypothetical protein
MATERTPEVVRAEIAAERDELAGAVEHLRGSLGEATDVSRKLPLLAAAATLAGFVLAGGVGSTMRYVARRGREGDERARLGRFRLLDLR